MVLVRGQALSRGLAGDQGRTHSVPDPSTALRSVQDDNTEREDLSEHRSVLGG